MPPTNLSFHLKALAAAQLVSVVQEGRFQRYRANLALMQDLIACLPRCRPEILEFEMTDKPLNVLFLCTHNSARSILAEAILNHIGRGRFKGFSAGSSPRDNQQPNPLGLQVLQQAGQDHAAKYRA